MRHNTKVTPGKYLQVGLLCLLPLSVITMGAAQETEAPTAMTAAQMDEEFPIPAPAEDSSDGYDLLVLAGKSIEAGGEGPPGAPAVSPEEDLRRQRAFIQKNAKALEMMREALSQPIVPPSGRNFFDLSSFGNNAALRNLASLAMQRNQVYAADKEWNKAINGALDIVQMGSGMGNHVSVIGMLVSGAIQNTGRADVWDWIENSDVKTALATAQRLENLDATAPSFATVMREEKWSGLAMLKGMLVSPEWEKFRQGDDTETTKAFNNPADVEALRTFSDRDILRHYTETMDAVVARAELPFAANPTPIASAADPMSDMVTSSYTASRKIPLPASFRAITEKTRAGNRLLMTALALQTFIKDNGHYPEKLDELRGKYLQEIPRDPFGADTPLIYRRQGDNYTLYSVGPNGVDDGGVTIKDKDETRIDGLTVEGDLVVGRFK